MSLSVFLAQVIGSFLVLTSLATLIYQPRFKKVTAEFISNSALVSFSGNLSILMGLLVVVSHNIWVSNWPVLITLIGWGVLLKGFSRIYFPEEFTNMMKKLLSENRYTLWSWFWLLIGIYLAWMGFSQY